MTVLIDGRPADAVPVADRGLNYGDGLFETIAVFDGQPCLWDEHITRLTKGCSRLGIPMPDVAALREDVTRLAEGAERAVLKLLLTRGEGGRGYRPPFEVTPRRVLSLHAWPDYPASFWDEGVVVRWCATPLGHSPVLAGLKHCNRLEQVLARAEWDDPAIPEGLMCDIDGHVIEGTQTNLFLWKDSELITPSLARCGVAGVARDCLIGLAKGQGMSVEERTITRDDVLTADALLLTNALIGGWPVRELDGHRYDPAAFPSVLLTAFMERIHRP